MPQFCHLAATLGLIAALAPPPLRPPYVQRARAPHRCARTRLRATDSTEELLALRKPMLVERCRERGLPVSGTKAELVDRLSSSKAPPPPIEPSRPPANPADPALADAAVDLLITEIVETQRRNESVSPELLGSKVDQLLSKEGAVLEAVIARRLAADPRNVALANAAALVRGYVRAEQRLRARDVMREILRAATLGAEYLDACFGDLAEAGRLDAPFRRYVDDLAAQQAAKPGDGLLDRVIAIVRDRVDAEAKAEASPELRCLARALRCEDDAATRAFLEPELATSLDFAQRFEAYVASAAAFASSAADGGGGGLAGVDRVQRVVAELRRQMPV